MSDKALPGKVHVLLPGGESMPAAGGRSLLEMGAELQPRYAAPIVAAAVDNNLYELTAAVEPPATVHFLDLTDKEGRRIYQRSLTFLLIAAVSELFPGAAVTVEHSLGKGLYCEIKKTPALSAADVTAIERRMRQLVEMDLPIEKRKVPPSEAARIFRRQGFDDKVALLKYWPKDYLNLYSIGEVEDTLYGYHVPRTGLLNIFELKYYPPGLILGFPAEEDPSRVAPFVDQKKLFEIFREAERWGQILGFDTVGAMNRLIEEGQGAEVVRVAEALHEKKIAQIADLISARVPEIRVILIAGPSSSGKTTFTQRLRIQLLVNGLRPLPISTDDYFLDRDSTPLDESNNPDFEHIEAVDLPLFNEHLLRLIEGEAVDLPVYNFHTGKREYRGRKMRLEENQPLIIEGIHGLNEILTRSIPRRSKFKIYISALTALNIDRHTRIHTTDTRLLRRIVRDAQFRGNSALETIRRWPSVRRGEERNIFRLQEEADIMFNSALVYELAVIKRQAEFLLKQIDSSHPEFIDAKRLLSFLSFFLPLDASLVPSNSLLREFIGQSCFFEPGDQGGGLGDGAPA
ncbi:MAG TPA: nucleoside kinase [Bacillota bacterium]|jgi:uridine kinase|nr:nucleoside kinase [Bacillota bacterium]HPZ12265.1 nucleoside kinase [Bacillota bacterium]HQE10551.1 nucleoside kinase [Bacillota bacterium]